MNGKLAALFAPVIQAALLAAHPVGSIHIRVDGIDPSTLFGGTWKRYAQGRVMIGTDTAHPLGVMGGEEMHTLTVAEMPSHSHSYERTPLWYSEQTGRTDVLGSDGSLDTYIVINSGYSGGGQPHNNMPPYIAVAIWKRTA